jgi:hypothetical protein
MNPDRRRKRIATHDTAELAVYRSTDGREWQGLPPQGHAFWTTWSRAEQKAYLAGLL